MQLANYHSHSSFSDGKGMPEEYLQNAIDQQLIAYGFSEHAPILGVGKSLMHLAELQVYLREIDRLKEAYQDRIQIYKSLEVDYIPGIIDIKSEHIKQAQLDYVIGAVHYIDYLHDGTPWGFEGPPESFQYGLDQLFDGDIQACIKRYYQLVREMVQTGPDIVAHLDRIKKQNKDNQYYDESKAWYQQEIGETLECIARSGAIMEINTKGYYAGDTEDTYPSKWILREALDLGIPVHFGSDSHRPDNITKGFAFAAAEIAEVGYTSCKLLYDGEWQDIPLKRSAIHFM